MSPESNFAALPVRQRGTLEIIDTAMKLYRRYFGVLMGWSALTALLFVVSLSATCGLGVLLVYPLIAGAGCCTIAAAVRGQRIAFGQVWEFTKPRYGALMLIAFLSGLLMSVASGVVTLIAVAISLAGTWLFSALNAPTEVTVIVAFIGTIIGLVVSGLLGVMAYAWLGLIPIIACLEDDKRSTAAIGRAWELMKGSWGRVLGLATLLSIAVVAVMGIIGGTVGLLGGGIGAFVDDPSEMVVLGLLLTYSSFLGLFLLFWNPIQTLVLAVLYLDLRVRKEALDLEWNSYASAPPVQNNAPETSAVELAANPATPELSPASMSGYAPGSSAPDTAATRPPMPLNIAKAPEITPTMPEVAPTMPEVAPTIPQQPQPVETTSSFSAAPSAPASPPQDASDFSSSFSARQADADSSSLDDGEDKRDRDADEKQ